MREAELSDAEEALGRAKRREETRAALRVAPLDQGVVGSLLERAHAEGISHIDPAVLDGELLYAQVRHPLEDTATRGAAWLS